MILFIQPIYIISAGLVRNQDLDIQSSFDNGEETHLKITVMGQESSGGGRSLRRALVSVYSLTDKRIIAFGFTFDSGVMRFSNIPEGHDLLINVNHLRFFRNWEMIEDFDGYESVYIWVISYFYFFS